MGLRPLLGSSGGRACGLNGLGGGGLSARSARAPKSTPPHRGGRSVPRTDQRAATILPIKGRGAQEFEGTANSRSDVCLRPNSALNPPPTHMNPFGAPPGLVHSARRRGTESADGIAAYIRLGA